MDRIVLKNMAFYGYHGNLASEQEQGQRFFVDVEIITDLTKAGQSDQLEDSINYVEVYEIVDNAIDIANNLNIDELLESFDIFLNKV